MSTVAFSDSSLLWKFKEFSSTRLSDAHDHERAGRALCGFESDPSFHLNSYFHLISDQGLTVGKGSCDEIRQEDPDIVLTSSDVYPVGKAGPIEFDGLFTNSAAQPQRSNKTSSNSEQIRACTDRRTDLPAPTHDQRHFAISDPFRFDRPFASGGHPIADPITINIQDAFASTGR